MKIKIAIFIFDCIVLSAASDFVKFSFTMAFTTTLLAWGLLSYTDAYEKAGELISVIFTLAFKNFS